MEHEIYREFILELNRNPLNKGVLSAYDATYRDYSTSCGDEIVVYIKFDKQGKASGIMHDGHGCAISQAAVSLLTDTIKGRSKEDMLAITPDDMIHMLGIPVTQNRMACAMLGLATLQKALLCWK